MSALLLDEAFSLLEVMGHSATNATGTDDGNDRDFNDQIEMRVVETGRHELQG